MRKRDLLPLFLLSVPLAAQASWSMLYPPVVPPTRYNAVMACHEATASVLLLFGQTTGGQIADCWRLDGASWSPVAGPLPPVRTLSAMVYDSVRERLVLFGGSAPGSLLQDDTWEWDGATWTNRSPAARPPARSGHMMAFDRARGVTVLYGGSFGSSTLASDLWEWDGVAWAQRTFAGGPGPRRYAVMAFDPVRLEVLLHGGSTTGSQVRNDTWTWNGTAWQQQFPLTPPPFRSNAAIASDWHRARVVLQGGGGYDSFAWEWDGSEWHMLLMASPSPRSNHVMTYDAPRRRVVLWGGDQVGVSAALDDTWAYATPLPADAVPFGTGCAGSNGTPTLAPAPYSLPWLGDTFRTRVDALPIGGIGAVIVSSFGTTPPIDLTPIGMPGCELLVPLDVLEWAPAVGGVAEWSYTAPLSMALAGVVWEQQGFPFDPAATAFGLSASNAIVATFGVR